MPDKSYHVEDKENVLFRNGGQVARIAATDGDGGVVEWGNRSEQEAFTSWCKSLRWIRVIPACTDLEGLGLRLLQDEAKWASWCEKQSTDGLVFSTDPDIRAGRWQRDPVLRADRVDDVELLHDLAEHVYWYWHNGRHATSRQVDDALPRECCDDWLPRLVMGGT
ncbi:MAG: hypothetical protein L0H59_01100 [Tomitella sp.]|nr:hypothetical protein [Tomitella sp.]